MPAEHLKVVHGSKSKEVGSKAWADKMRKNAVEVAHHLETGYMDLAKILYDLYDVPVDGDPDKGCWLSEWGYPSIGDFAESELGIKRRKAEYLRAIWYRLEVEMSDMDPKVKADVVALGWSKVRELIKVLTIKNAEKWIDIAKNSNYGDLCASVRKYRDKLESAHAAKDLGEKYVAPVPTKVTAPQPKGADLPTAFKPVLVDGDHDSEESVADLEPVKTLTSADGEKLYPKHFALPADQLELLNAALKRAAELSNSAVPSHNLGIVCQDFLATNMFGKADQDQLLRFMAKYEQIFNVRIVVIDQDDDPIYGMSHLEDLSKKMGGS
jgi:hypothetical protein